MTDEKREFSRLQELALYIVSTNVDNASFGARELMSSLFMLDSLSLSELGHPLTNLRYSDLPTGPDLLFISPSTLASDLFALEPPQEGLVALRAADLSVFSPPEQRLIKAAVEDMRTAPPGSFTIKRSDLTSHRRALMLNARS